MKEVDSPCIKLCKLDESNMCLGCARSLEEIACWRQMNNEEKQSVLDAVKARGEISDLTDHCELT